MIKNEGGPIATCGKSMKVSASAKCVQMYWHKLYIDWNILDDNQSDSPTIHEGRQFLFSTNKDSNQSSIPNFFWPTKLPPSSSFFRPILKGFIQNDLKRCVFFCWIGGKKHLESQIAINYQPILCQPTLAPGSKEWIFPPGNFPGFPGQSNSWQK